MKTIVAVVKKAGGNATMPGLFVWLEEQNHANGEYFQLSPVLGDQLLSTALTAISTGKLVEVTIGEGTDVKDAWNNYYCYTMYILS